MKLFSPKRSEKKRAQAILEFALILPILIMLLYSIIEVGRLIFIFSSVANASRQAARYGSASGKINSVAFYQDCNGIRAVANQSAFIIKFDKINITYDRGVNPDGTQIPIAGVDPNPTVDSCPIKDYTVRNGDRIIVQVSTKYEPILKLLPIKPLDVVSASARSFLISIPIVGNALPTGFAAETSTPSPSPTIVRPTNTITFTPTFTATHIPTSISMGKLTPVDTNTPTATATPTNTPLPTSTATPTATQISCTGLTGVSHGPLVVRKNIMEMTINNKTGHILTAALVYVEWNQDTGHISFLNRNLHLKQVVLNEQTWEGDVHAPSFYIPAYYPHIPLGESVIQFVFDQSYDVQNGTERVIVNISNPGCINYPVDSSK
jgi:hypothetical protein